MCKLGLGPVPSIWLAKKFLCFFSHRSALVALSQLSLTSFETILLDCIVTAVISASSKKKKLAKIGDFLCSHFNIEEGRKYTSFSAYYVLLFQER